MEKKVFVITGANTGIGKETALSLAKENSRVVIVSRDSEKSRKAIVEIKKDSGNEDVVFIPCDLSSFSSIRKAAKIISMENPVIDVLIHNAGIYKVKRELTEDGIETTFVVNHLSSVLLTHLLLENLQNSKKARIICVNSELHRRAKLNINDLFLHRKYNGILAYNNSKLANLLYSYELSERLSPRGITVNCVHPGVVATEIARDYPKLILFIFSFFILNPEEGAAPSIDLAISDRWDGVTGKYFKRHEIVKSSPESYNQELREKIWKISEYMTGIGTKV